MNYPYWDTGVIGGGPLVALIAVLHVFVAHIAVGGGLFIWWLDRKARLGADAALDGFVRRYTGVFLLMSLVFGAVTGVGIWFVIALVNPAATSSLIHTFVFGWAIEWVFFLGEILALLLYHYRFEKMARGTRSRMAFLYFVFAWLSLFTITGILSYMLTPGAWLETRSFWDGFLNPGFLPSVAFRTFVAVLCAGCFGALMGARQADVELRGRVLKTVANWIFAAAVGLLLSGAWLWHSTPAEVRDSSLAHNPEIAPWAQAFLGASIVIALGALVLSRRAPQALHKATAVVIVLAGLVWMGGFEYTREFARRPWVIHGYMYANEIVAGDEALADKPFLQAARWVAPEERDGDEAVQGRALFELQCMRCHTVGGRNDITPLTADLTFIGMQAKLAGLGEIDGYMPPFFGTDAERAALAAYLVGTVHGKSLVREPEPFVPRGSGFAMPEPVGNDDWTLLAWNDLGMHCISDSDSRFVILPPANSLEAQLIKRGDQPEIVTEGVKLTYAVEEGFEHPSKEVPFWDHAEAVFGKKPAPDVGLAGHGMTGELHADPVAGAFAVHKIPVVPYRADGVYDPYPLFTIEARAEESGELLARTKVVAPTSTEMGCRNCHGGPWRRDGQSGVSVETADAILRAHDRLSGTTLLADAVAGKPRMCQSCHEDPAVGSKGDGQRRSLSAAIHGFHAHTMHEKGATSCGLCHPALPNGRTRCLRGVHQVLGLTCVNCHGTLDEHALSLLKFEQQRGREGSARLMAHLETEHVDAPADVKPRQSWLQQPDCLSCHKGFREPETDTTFNDWVPHPAMLYRIRTDATGMRCEACHGAPHALYPSGNDFEQGIDNIQPMQLQGNPGPIGTGRSCKVCHTEVHDVSGHHPNMVRDFRNDDLFDEVAPE